VELQQYIRVRTGALVSAGLHLQLVAAGFDQGLTGGGDGQGDAAAVAAVQPGAHPEGVLLACSAMDTKQVGQMYI
jgi:hypothetical protein